MMQDRTSRHWRVLANRVSVVLHRAWDPLGVADEPDAPEEYQNYVPEVARLLDRNASNAEIAALLTHIRRERMGLTGDDEHDLQVAAMLMTLNNRG